MAKHNLRQVDLKKDSTNNLLIQFMRGHLLNLSIATSKRDQFSRP